MASEKLSGDGSFTKRCHELLEHRYGFQQALLTTSGTDALELAALLASIGPNDEVIVPSFTFVSSANAFALRGARIVFADSCGDNPNVDPDELERLITPKTKVIVVVHYAGMACEMDRIMTIAQHSGVMVVEDAAQALDATYNGMPLGSFGVFSAFSFHDTKNITCGEGGLLVVNDSRYARRAEIIREKGTNRAAFFRGEVDRYGWLELGSSFLPSELNAAFLLGQLERIEDIQARRAQILSTYLAELGPVLSRAGIDMLQPRARCVGNAHTFYLVLRSLQERSDLLQFLSSHGISAASHYNSLHRSVYFRSLHGDRALPASDRFSDCLLRLPLYFGLHEREQAFIVESVRGWVKALSPR